MHKEGGSVVGMDTCDSFGHSISMPRNTMGVITSQNRGVKITILARQFWMAKLSIPKCSPLNFIMFSSNNHLFESNIDHFMAK